ncbi:putative alcohol dehydrogenase [Saccharata proteae CBS 121410]|uniref:Alcohol dehydrogenase n=1 Tax=Saccharata proteae CBS 121410 TaxID=1314787 RepID=A0A9P4LV42_9PEZI|nr:putative alcohol dehydrogenase [Saccharata proteae CBS 121410]
MSSRSDTKIPKVQTAAVVHELGGPVIFQDDYPVPTPGQNEVLAKVLYSGVCQRDLHTKQGTAAGPDGLPITEIALPHIGGHECVGRVVAIGPNTKPGIGIGQLVGIRFSSRICRRCQFCLAEKEQHCVKSTNHLHHEPGSFQEYIALDADYLTILPADVDPVVIGPVLCAGLTAYKAVLSTSITMGEWLVVIGAGGGLGHLAVQYALAAGAQVVGVDAGWEKGRYLLNELGVHAYVDVQTCDLTCAVLDITSGGAHAIIVTADSADAFKSAADMLRVGGVLSCVGIPPGKAFIEVPVASIVIKSLRITGNLVGSLKECLEAVELVRMGVVKPKVVVREFRELEGIYGELERGEISGRVVVRIARDEQAPVLKI